MWEAIQKWVGEHEALVILIGLGLSALGAYQLVHTIARTGRKTYRRIKLRRLNKGAKEDFFYRERILGYRMCEDGSYLSIRDEVIVLLQRRDAIRFGFGWTGEGRLEEELLSPADAQVKILDRPSGSDTDLTSFRHLVKRNGHPFEKGETVRFGYRVRGFAENTKPQPHLSSKSEHRIDRLVLRVAFPLNAIPETVVFEIRGRMGESEREPKKLPVDPLSGECRVEEERPRPNTRYLIRWDASTRKSAM